MQRISILLCLIVACFATAMQAQAPAPKPNPEVKKLQAYVGHWAVEGEMRPGPWGPGVKISQTYDGKMILGGFYMQGFSRDNAGVLQLADYFAYDPANKKFIGNTFDVTGERITWVGTVSGSTFNWTGKAVDAVRRQINVPDVSTGCGVEDANTILSLVGY